MKEYEHKYLNDTLLTSELEKFRDEINSAEGEDLDKIILESWNEECLKDYDCFTEQDKKRLKKLDHKIHASNRRRYYWGAAGWVLCVCLAGALALSNVTNIRKTLELTSRDVVITTSEGEKSTIALPDGSKVNLNYCSSLSYNQADFIKGNRNVVFNGEGYFDVQKMNGVPFVISSGDLSVVVKGTKFNYNNRTDSKTATLALFEGRLTLVSGKDNNMTEVSPGQVASFDKTAGLFELKSSDYIETMSAWTKGEIVFRRATLPRVLEILGYYYGYKVTASSDIRKLSNTFSGTLPLSDINDAMTILELLYPINTVIVDKHITVCMNNSAKETNNNQINNNSTL